MTLALSVPLPAGRGTAPIVVVGSGPSGLRVVQELLRRGVERAIVLCGAGGLALGQAVVFPGRHSRLRNLAIVGREAGAMFAGCILLFLAAGAIEGGFRQTVTDTGSRWIVAFLGAFALTAYFVAAGRRP